MVFTKIKNKVFSFLKMLTIKERFFYAVVVVLCGFLVWLFVFWKAIPPYEKLTVLLNERKYEELIKEGELFLNTNSQDDKFVILMSRAYFDFGVVSGERDLYTKKALALIDAVTQKSFDLLMTKGYIYLSIHNLDGARAAYQEALSLNPQSVEVVVKLAQINELDKNIGEALKLYTKALKLNPGNHDAIIGYLRIKKIYKEYDYVFNKATDLLKYARDKDFIVSLEEILATEYGRRKDYENAKKMYRQILKEQPNRIASLVGLADVLLKSLYKNLLQEGNSLDSLLQEPEQLALSALSLDPDFIYTYLVLLDIERLRNNADQEKKYTKKAEELFRSQKFLAAERNLIESRLKSLPQAKISIIKK